MVLKLEQGSESPREFVKTQIAGPTPRVSGLVSVGGANNLHFEQVSEWLMVKVWDHQLEDHCLYKKFVVFS